MKTTEEIFNEHSWNKFGYISPSKDYCIPAMKEHTEQALHEVLKRWCSQNFGTNKPKSLAEIVLEVKKELNISNQTLVEMRKSIKLP